MSVSEKVVISFLAVIGCCCFGFSTTKPASAEISKDDVVAVLKDEVLAEADSDLSLRPVTITAYRSPRSEGNKHEFFSEGDYWWPNPENPEGAFIRKDGKSNPGNFTDHRLALIRFSKIIGALASAYKLTRDEKYVRQATRHLKAWFVDTATLMNPDMLYAQAVKGLYAGRGIGIIDAVHLMEVAQGAKVMQQKINPSVLRSTKEWFNKYLYWLMHHPYGKAEMNEKNNHGTCFVMQVACFSRFTGNQKLINFCKKRYKKVLLPNQMAGDGSFPLELARTKSYGYSIFNLDAMATICQILSTHTDNLWQYRTPDGRSIKKGIEFLYPFIANKYKWKLKPDVMYWKQWPVAQPFLVFGALAFNKMSWFATWAKLDHQPKVEEVVRNLPVKYPLIWIK